MKEGVEQRFVHDRADRSTAPIDIRVPLASSETKKARPAKKEAAIVFTAEQNKRLAERAAEQKAERAERRAKRSGELKKIEEVRAKARRIAELSQHWGVFDIGGQKFAAGETLSFDRDGQTFQFAVGENVTIKDKPYIVVGHSNEKNPGLVLAALDAKTKSITARRLLLKSERFIDIEREAGEEVVEEEAPLADVLVKNLQEEFLDGTGEWDSGRSLPYTQEDGGATRELAKDETRGGEEVLVRDESDEVELDDDIAESEPTASQPLESRVAEPARSREQLAPTELLPHQKRILDLAIALFNKETMWQKIGGSKVLKAFMASQEFRIALSGGGSFFSNPLENIQIYPNYGEEVKKATAEYLLSKFGSAKRAGEFVSELNTVADTEDLMFGRLSKRQQKKIGERLTEANKVLQKMGIINGMPVEGGTAEAAFANSARVGIHSSREVPIALGNTTGARSHLDSTENAFANFANGLGNEQPDQIANRASTKKPVAVRASRGVGKALRLAGALAAGVVAGQSAETPNKPAAEFKISAPARETSPREIVQAPEIAPDVVTRASQVVSRKEKVDAREEIRTELAEAAQSEQMMELRAAELYANLEAENVTDTGERMAKFSEVFLGSPAAWEEWNEKDAAERSGKDGMKDRFKLTNFSCTSFVEHLLALAGSKDLESAKDRLDKVQFSNGQVGFGSLRHWADAQWVPGLIAEGILEDVTPSLAAHAKVSVGETSVTISPALARDSVHVSLAKRLKDNEIPNGTFRTDYIPKDAVEKVAKSLEAGTIVNVVKMPKSDLVLERIAHQGIVVRKDDGRVYVRHASTATSAGKVVEQPLSVFLHKQSSRLLGFQFLKPVGPREQPQTLVSSL